MQGTHETVDIASGRSIAVQTFLNEVRHTTHLA
jgi:hypothetical protein